MTQSKKNLVVCFRSAPVEQVLIDRIARCWPEVHIINTDQKGIAKALWEADYFCGHAKVPVDWDGIVAQGRLKWIQSSAAGMDWCLVPSVIASEITVTTAAGVLSDQVSEHGLALILAWHRNLQAFISDQYFASDNPDYHAFKRKPTDDLTGKTVGIVGLGGVGRRMAQVVAPFARRIIATDLFPQDKPAEVAELWAADRLDDLLTQADVVILCLPLNSTTRGLFTAEKFRLMKRTALFANMARGPLVETEALVQALKEQDLAGAIMDVTSPEPLPKDHPLWTLPNVLITPHVAGQIRWRFEDICDIFCENVRRYKSGEPLINLLSPRGKELGFPLRDGSVPLWIDVKKQYTTRGEVDARS
ncbi:MAG: D-2-hydroxyacid dehydrogenase [Planctomycetia bacterium]|nr:D-2-hydroxyacid dehydrogenase [Planctomycetia bacterium]